MQTKIDKKKANYQKFIQSKEWHDIRDNLFAMRGKKCAHCGSVKHIHVHHKTYKRFGGKERPEDLLILCSKCHASVHKVKPNKKKQGRIYYRTLAGKIFDIPKETSTTWKGMARAIALTRGVTLGKLSKPKAMKQVKMACKG